jgi:hypothetical protein
MLRGEELVLIFKLTQSVHKARMSRDPKGY